MPRTQRRPRRRLSNPRRGAAARPARTVARLRVRHIIPYGVLCTECHDYRRQHHTLRPLGDEEALRRCALLGHDLAPVAARTDDRRRWRCQRAGCHDTLVDYRQRAEDPPQWMASLQQNRENPR